MIQNQVFISEVGPRDGLQSIATVMPTNAKKAWIQALVDSGIREIEVGSFVPAKLFPQLADTAEICQFATGVEGLTVAALVPNLRGAEAAINAGAHKISLPFSVSESHSQRNLRRSHVEVIEEISRIREHISSLPKSQQPHFETSLSTAFGCTIEGVISESFVLEKAEQLLKAGADEVGLSDTTGYGNPAQVKRLVRGIKSNFGSNKLTGVHLHNTRGLGLANALAALEEGIETLDSSYAGLGGCPYAPGASGNIVTEDLAFMLEAMGIETGIDLDKLLDVKAILAEALPNEELYGFISDAGLPKQF